MRPDVIFGKDGWLWTSKGRRLGRWYRHLGDWGATMEDGTESPWCDTQREVRAWVAERAFSGALPAPDKEG